MLTKLRNNYKLSNILVRIAFVLAFVFANWQTGLAAVMLTESYVQTTFTGAVKLIVALLSVAFSGTIWMFLLPPITNVVLNFAKIHSVPRNEYCVLVHAFFALGYFICGVLNLVNVFTPLFAVWGRILFPFVSSLVAVVLFYKVTSKLYFNSATTVYYFKVCAIAYLAIVFVLEVLA